MITSDTRRLDWVIRNRATVEYSKSSQDRCWCVYGERQIGPIKTDLREAIDAAMKQSGKTK